MLKIKDNVDLKELLKYDFYYDKDQKCYFKEIKLDNLFNMVFLQGAGASMYIDEENRIIGAYGGIGAKDMYVKDEYIEDLIKADLVENAKRRINNENNKRI